MGCEAFEHCVYWYNGAGGVDERYGIGRLRMKIALIHIQPDADYRVAD